MQATSSSRFLDSLSQELLSCLLPDMEAVSLRRGDILYAAGDLIDWVYFPVDAMISSVVVLANGTMIEAQAVGSDGFTPLLLALDMDRAESTAMVQIPGPALRINSESFRRHLQSPELRRHTWSYMADTLRLIGQSAACIAFHPLQARLATVAAHRSRQHRPRRVPPDPGRDGRHARRPPPYRHHRNAPARGLRPRRAPPRPSSSCRR